MLGLDSIEWVIRFTGQQTGELIRSQEKGERVGKRKGGSVEGGWVLGVGCWVLEPKIQSGTMGAIGAGSFGLVSAAPSDQEITTPAARCLQSPPTPFQGLRLGNWLIVRRPTTWFLGPWL